MEQRTNKMFRGCPYEQENIECKACPKYEYCLQMKERRRKEYLAKRAKARKQMFCKIYVVAITILCIVLLISLIVAVSGKNKETANETSDSTSSINVSKVEITTTITSIMEETEPTLPTLEETHSTEPVMQEAVLSADGPSDTYYYNLTDEEKIIIAKVVWAESRGESFKGKVAVAAVILNRYYSGSSYFDTESISAVVTQPYQFASIKNVSVEDLEENLDCIRAVEAACKGWDPTREMFPNGALYFYAPKGVSGYQAEIREGIRVLVIGNHNFHYDFEKVE